MRGILFNGRARLRAESVASRVGGTLMGVSVVTLLIGLVVLPQPRELSRIAYANNPAVTAPAALNLTPGMNDFDPTGDNNNSPNKFEAVYFPNGGNGSFTVRIEVTTNPGGLMVKIDRPNNQMNPSPSSDLLDVYRTLHVFTTNNDSHVNNALKKLRFKTGQSVAGFAITVTVTEGSTVVSATYSDSTQNSTQNSTQDSTPASNPPSDSSSSSSTPTTLAVTTTTTGANTTTTFLKATAINNALDADPRASADKPLTNLVRLDLTPTDDASQIGGSVALRPGPNEPALELVAIYTRVISNASMSGWVKKSSAATPEVNVQVDYSGADYNKPEVWAAEGFGEVCWKDDNGGMYLYTLVDPSKSAGRDLTGYVYSNVIVKAGSVTDPTLQVNTIFKNPALGQGVYADVNRSGTSDPGGRTGDKQISHVVFCAKKGTATTASTAATATSSTAAATSTTAGATSSTAAATTTTAAATTTTARATTSTAASTTTAATQTTAKTTGGKPAATTTTVPGSKDPIAFAMQSDAKVTLCHRTSSKTNPYVSITVDQSAVLKEGHGSHTGPLFPEDNLGDIIPAFGGYPGLNWPAGKAIFDAGCNALGAKNAGKVTLCHRTSSRTNPYVSITVDASAVLKEGHGSHTGPLFPEDNWGDIIPAFDGYPGLNWPAGLSIYENDCDASKAKTTQNTTDPTGNVNAITTTTTSGAQNSPTTTSRTQSPSTTAANRGQSPTTTSGNRGQSTPQTTAANRGQSTTTTATNRGQATPTTTSSRGSTSPTASPTTAPRATTTAPRGTNAPATTSAVAGAPTTTRAPSIPTPTTATTAPRRTNTTAAVSPTTTVSSWRSYIQMVTPTTSASATTSTTEVKLPNGDVAAFWTPESQPEKAPPAETVRKRAVCAASSPTDFQITQVQMLLSRGSSSEVVEFEVCMNSFTVTGSNAPMDAFGDAVVADPLVIPQTGGDFGFVWMSFLLMLLGAGIFVLGRRFQ